ncbi:MAG: phage shock protein operon transcriptional activator [Deltaproteobacteria bacterium]|nr:phage shock protein operon transcriptional activator [Deltaproteobacteria bacterium]
MSPINSSDHSYLKTDPTPDVAEALGESEAFLEFQDRLSRVAPINRPVLLIGERGTGKELAASRLHYLSKRWQGPMVALNCAALNPSLIESELFGYEKGAFTGAEKRRSGRFESADSGSLFLDEIGTVPMEVQEKILRVVEYGAFERVGSPRSIEVDVRIIAATNADLPVMASLGKFKQDLLDRLSFEVLHLPPLRERKRDIALLANHFAARMAFELGQDYIPRFGLQALAALESHTWPGNIRELKNTVERAVYRSDTEQIDRIVFDPFISPYASAETDEARPEKPQGVAPAKPEFGNLLEKSIHEAVDELKTIMVKKALISAAFNQKQAAKDLGLTYDQFRGLYRKYAAKIKDF